MTARILEGMKVLDLTHAMAGPFCTQRLADMGAEVIKVEPPLGDGQRSTMIANARYEDFTTVFLSLNRNKKSISIDLKRPEGLELLYRLVAACNVVVQNFRPAVVRRLKIDYESLRAKNGSIIYCSISGYGDEGPYAKRPGQDLILQGYSGLMYNVGAEGDEPAPAGSFLVDVTASHLATEGILAAYIHYMRTGRGQRVDVNMLEGILDHQVQETTTILNTGIVATRTSEKLAHTYIGGPYGVYETADGYMTMAMTNVARLGAVVGSKKLEAMTRRRDAHNHRDDIVRILRPLLKQKPTQHWIDLFDENGIWCGPVKALKETLADAQIERNRYIGRVARDDGPDLLLPRNPIRFSEGELPMTMPPRLGEHSVEVMESVGYRTDQIRELLDSGVVIRSSRANVVDLDD
jgi:crotonobetainyl-CoA:carnitine CoA-transferase CaiB-like acyl-CoA transferase